MNYKLVKTSELEKLLKTAREVKQDERDEAYNRGYEDGKSEYASEVEELQETVEEQEATLKKKNREISNLIAELEVLNKQKTEARDVVTKRLENEDKAAELNTRELKIYKKEEALDKREAKLVESEGNTEDKNYKSGYADGVADGVRKISEITAADRKDAMDVAKISAASHTKSETVKAVLDAKTTSTLANKEDK